VNLFQLFAIFPWKLVVFAILFAVSLWIAVDRKVRRDSFRRIVIIGAAIWLAPWVLAYVHYVLTFAGRCAVSFKRAQACSFAEYLWRGPTFVSVGFVIDLIALVLMVWLFSYGHKQALSSPERPPLPSEWPWRRSS
jgi:hypothetical protein